MIGGLAIIYSSPGSPSGEGGLTLALTLPGVIEMRESDPGGNGWTGTPPLFGARAGFLPAGFWGAGCCGAA